jgi:hypothetical protein
MNLGITILCSNESMIDALLELDELQQSAFIKALKKQ